MAEAIITDLGVDALPGGIFTFSPKEEIITCKTITVNTVELIDQNKIGNTILIDQNKIGNTILIDQNKVGDIKYVC